MKKIFIIVLSFLFFSNLQFASASLYDQASSESSHTYSSNVNNGTTASWTVSNLPADFVVNSITIKAFPTYDGCVADDWQLTAYNNDTFHPVDFSIETNPSYSNSPDLSSQNGLVTWKGLNLAGAQLNNTWYLSVNARDSLGFGCISDHGHGEASVTVADTIATSTYVSQFKTFGKTYYPNFTPYVIFNVVSERVPVLIVPGIMGTEIFKGSEELWPDVNRMLRTPGDSFMDSLSLNSDGSMLDTSLVLGNVLRQPYFINADYSKTLIDDLVNNKKYTENLNLFLFAYDWRRSSYDSAVINDSELKKPSLLQEIDKIIETSKTDKVDIIAHSQGGLVVKRLLYEHPEYKNKINKLIFVGVPNLGAPKAAKVLLYGDSMDIAYLGMGLDPNETKKISQNMPSVYELLPSQEYFNKHEQYISEQQPTLSSPGAEVPDFYQSYDFLGTKTFLANKGLNSQLINQADNFHSSGYDNLDFTGSGIKTYNIVGCQTDTLDKIMVPLNRDPYIITTAGDGTVPLDSANNIPGAQTFYAFDSSHATMLTQDGIRQEIENLLTDGSLSTNDKITQFSNQCHYNSTIVSVHSPVNLNVYDEQGNHLGPNDQGGVDTNIYGAQYDVIGHSKFAFLPPGHNYTIKLIATGAGHFDLYSGVIKDGQEVNTAYYSSVPISSTSTADLVLNSTNDQTINFTSDNRIIVPSAILDSSQFQDITSPISTSTISGLMGQEGFYRGEATVTISSIDPIVNNNPSQTSGVLKMQYSLDGGEYKTCQPPLTPPQQGGECAVSVSTEGQHTVKFFSTDRAGNNEAEKSISFVIDKTAPELGMQFNIVTQDLEFTATDTLPTVVSATSTPIKSHPLKVVDADNVITATDAAGNITVLTFKDKDRKHQFKADVKSLSYNGVNQDISKLQLHFDWLYDKKGKLQILTQNVQSKKEFNVSAIYALGKTIILGKDQNGKINKVISGIVPLKINTNLGNFVWAY